MDAYLKSVNWTFAVNRGNEEGARFVCPECGKSYDSHGRLRTHINRIHKRPDMAPCEECGKILVSKAALKKHVDCIHRGIVNYYKCDICGLILKSQTALHRHNKYIHLKKFSAYCDICNKGFACPSALEIHKKSVHEGEVTIIPCTEEGCKKTFRATTSLKHHLLAEHATDKPEFLCPDCGKTYNLISSFRKHVWQHKTGRRLHKCTVCGKAVTSPSSLKSHMFIHTGEKPFICEVCGQGFNKLRGLNDHMLVHTKERCFACKFCDKKYAHPCTLGQHVRKSHPHSVKKVDNQNPIAGGEKVLVQVLVDDKQESKVD